MDNHNPVFEPLSIGLEELCYCNAKWPLKITIMDWQRNGKHREIGSVETTVANIMERVSKRGNADREHALVVSEDYATGGNCGLIVVISAKVSK